MRGVDGIAINLLGWEFAITGMQVQTMAARYESISQFDIGSQLIGSSCATRIATGYGQASTQFRIGCFKATDIVALPTIQRDCHGGQARQRGFNIAAHGSITFLC
jgi:hypothetical protein